MAQALRVASQQSSRAANKAQRAERRNEIIRRWQARKIRHSFPNDPNGWVEALIESGITRAQLTSDVIALDLWERPQIGFLVWRLVEIIRLKEMPYRAYLGTEHWRDLSEATKQRWQGRCALDDSHLAEHAHHRTYIRRGHEWPEDLIALCADCHAKFHDR